MKEKQEAKKEKRYFCDLCKLVLDKDNFFHDILVICVALGYVAIFFISIIIMWLCIYESKKNAGALEFDREGWIKELKEDIGSYFKEGEGFDEIAFQEQKIVETYKTSYEKGKTVYDFKTRDPNGVSTRITMTFSEKYELLESSDSMEKNYARELKRSILTEQACDMEIMSGFIMVDISFIITVIAYLISKKHKEKDQKQQK